MSDFLGEILSLGEPPHPPKKHYNFLKGSLYKKCHAKVATFGGFVFPEITIFK
jgi:hypothetical protein